MRLTPRARLLPLLLAAALAAACEPTTTAATPEGADKPASVKGKDEGQQKKPAPRTAGIGDKVKDGKFTFKVTKAGPGPAKIGSGYLVHEPQGRFWMVYVTVHNHGDEAQHFTGGSQKLLAGKKEFSADGEAAIYLKNSKSLLTEINPGNTVKGVIVYDIPKKAKPTAIELHDSSFSGGVRVSLAG